MKKPTRRDFLKGITAGGALSAAASGPSVASAAGPSQLKTAGANKTHTICPYCAVGCGMVVYSKGGKIVAAEGDYDHPVNKGSLCSKGAAVMQISDNPRRLTHVMYRAPGTDKWEKKSVGWAVAELAKRVKDSRDNNFIAAEDGVTVNRTEAVASVGAAALDNEECYLICKLMRALGVVYLEHQARLCHSSTVAALANSFGRGAMTNHWIDIKNSDCVFVIGSNPAENHPISFRWITEAMDKGAKLIVADPRFTRSAARADIFAAHRPGTDIALVGGMINYALSHGRYHEEYVSEYTNAGFILKEGFGFEDGLFTGYDPATRSYDASSWAFETAKDGSPKVDKTLRHPRSVFSFLKHHYARYTPEMVSGITGVPVKTFRRMAETFCATGESGKSGTIMYAMGATQHTVGVQYIRSYAVLQLLLGNIGVPGGGINALRGESNVQGSTDMAVLTHILPGYLAAPRAKDHPTLEDYLRKETPKTGYWKNKPKFMVSLLKAFFGGNATKDNGFGYDWLPKAGKGFDGAGYSFVPLIEAAHAGDVEGLMVWGQNPAVGCPDSNRVAEALGKLKWLAVFDLWESDTSVFWRRPGTDPANVDTEVFLFPAAASFEKEGSITNSGRWLQWRYKAIEPPGDARSDLDWVNLLGRELKRLYSEGGTFPDPVAALDWDYGETEADTHKVAREVNGYDTVTGAQAKNFTVLRDDGTTACGNWLYSGSYPGPSKDDNMMARRGLEDPSGLGLYPGFSFSWPVNRRVLYNRCSADRQGRPWDPSKNLVEWDPVSSSWRNNDVPDFGWKDSSTGRHIPPEVSAGAAFIMPPSLHGQLFVPGGKIKDGPVPEHYEPVESPIHNPLSGIQVNPAAILWDVPVVAGDGRYPVIATTFRLTGHWLSGMMSRNIPWLAEMAPEMFVEISRELARARGIEHGEWVKVVSPRGEVPARAFVTGRLRAYDLGGKRAEVVGMPWHFGFNGYVTGGPDRDKVYSANQLTHRVGDANTQIPEYKVFMCDIVKA